MNRPNVEIRRATTKDLESFYGKVPRASMKAWIAFWKGEAACVAGIAFESFGAVAFSNVKPNIDAPKITIWRVAKAIFEEMKSKGLPLLVHANVNIPTSGRFLQSLGFIFVRMEPDGNLLYGLKK